MRYTKREEYSFSVPTEFKAYLAFKEKLKGMGVAFLETGGSAMQVISTVDRARFDVDSEGNFLNKED